MKVKSSKPDIALVWFRHDLRLADNPALTAALKAHRRVLLLYIWSTVDQGGWPVGEASRAWLAMSLGALSAQVAARGGGLHCVEASSTAATLQAVAAQVGATAVYAAQAPDPVGARVDAQVTQLLSASGIRPFWYNTHLVHEPSALRTQSGTPYRVFTRFFQAWQGVVGDEPPLGSPMSLPCVKAVLPQEFDPHQLLPEKPWAGQMLAHWPVGEVAAQGVLQEALARVAKGYEQQRDIPSVVGTSRLSPHLHFGELSVRQVLWAARTQALRDSASLAAFKRELAWREFAHYVLYHFPHTLSEPMDRRFAAFPWREDDDTMLRSWRRGNTGIPLVDAGMRELWRTGWMHNRVRMVVASFLTKNVLLDWRVGAAWFWDTLVDADLANNTLGWQWTAGCGVDAAPFFRIFNPVTQGEKFDARGEYVRRWVPEIARLPDTYVHQPWMASPMVLVQAGVRLGIDYPLPVVDLKGSRERALAAFKSLRNND